MQLRHFTLQRSMPASDAMASLLQLGQLSGMQIGPDIVSLGNGRGIQIMIGVASLAVMIIGIARRYARP